MNKAYSRINFQNAPSTATPLNATNLNKMDKAINDLDDRIIELQGYQEEAEEAAEEAAASASAASKALETVTADAEARVNEIIAGMEVYTKEEANSKFASAIKQTASGSPVLITDSVEGKVLDFKGKGRSTQKQYSGKNLLCSRTTLLDWNGITYTPVTNENGELEYISISGTRTSDTYYVLPYDEVSTQLPSTLKAGEKYIISANSTHNNIDIRVYEMINGAYVTAVATTTEAEWIPNKDATKTIIRINVGATTAINDVRVYPMIRRAEVTDGTYEPYVGGTASPNPDYPQTIESVADGGYFDGELLNGYYNSSTGEYVFQASGRICSKNPIPCKSGDVVKIVLENNVSNMYICYYGENGYISMLYGTENANFIEKTIPNGATYFTFWAVNSGMTVDTVGHITVTINGKYALIVKSKGKNLFDITQLLKASGWKESNGEYKGTHSALNSVFGANTNGFNVPKFEENTQYTLSLLAYEVGGGIGQITFQYTDGTSNFVRIPSTTMTKYTLTSASGKTISKILGSYADGSGSELHIKDIQLEIGTVATEYEPHKEEVKYIPLNEPLRSSLDGIVTDEVSFSEVTRRFKEVVFDGSSDELWSTYAPQESRPDGTYCYFVSVADNKKMEYNSSTCTHFNNKVSAWTIGGVGTFSDHNKNNYLYFVTDKSTFSEWKTWLQANPITVIYELAEPITETIEPVDIVTYDNVTYISNADNAEMEVTYATDTKSYIDSKFAELQAALVNML